MTLATLFKCCADEQRLRILNLLAEGPLCVCHVQDVLSEGQVKISKQLGYMKRAGLLSAQRDGFWMIYRLAEPTPAVVADLLASLRREGALADTFASDLGARAEIMARLQTEACDCPKEVIGEPVAVAAGASDITEDSTWEEFPL